MLYLLAAIVSISMSSAAASSVFNDEQCMRKVSVISSNDLDVTQVPFQNNRDLVSLQETWERLQLNTMSPGEQASYYSYPYFLHLNILCNDQISSEMSHKLVALGAHPQVQITHRPLHIEGCHDGGITRYTMSGALVDLGKDDPLNPDECDGMSSCHLSWVTPLVMDNCSVIIQVDVESGSVDRLVLPTRHFINSDGYTKATTVEAGKTAIFRSVLGAHLEVEDLFISDITPHRITHIPSATPTLVIGGIGQSNTVIVSASEFQDYEVIQVTIPTDIITCSNSNTSQNILQAASLPDRILFSTSAGLFETFGSYGILQDGPVSLTPVLPGYCIKEVVLSTHTYTEHVVVLALGSKEGKEVVMTSTVQTGTAMEMMAVVDENQETVCEAIAQPGSSCSLVAGGINGVHKEGHKGTFVLLLLVNGTEEMGMYHTVAIQDASEDGIFSFGNWIKLVSFPAMQIPSGESNHHDHQIQLAPQEETLQFQDGNLNIIGLSFIGLVSQHLFMWGNFLLHSPDGGTSVFLLPQYTSHSMIVSLAVSHTNAFAFINEHQELWYGIIGDTVSLHQIRPSPGWSLQFTTKSFMQSGSDDNEGVEESTLTLFFDESNQLLELMASKNRSNSKLDIFRRMVPISEVVAYDNYIDTHGNVHENELDQRKGTCPFLSISFEANIKQFTERIQHFVFSKPHLTNPMQLHTNNSLLVYQGIVHQAILQSLQDKPKGVVSLYDPVARWKAAKSVLKDYYEWLYRTKRAESGIHVPIEEFGKIYEGNDHVDRDLLSVVYLDHGSSFNFTVYLSLDLPDIHVVALDSLWLAVDVSDITLIEVLVSRVVNYLTNHVIYQVYIQYIQDKGRLNQQAPSGLRLHPASMLLQVWNSAFNCIKNTDQEKQDFEGSYSMNVLLGCAPGSRLIFDLNATLEYAKSEFEVIYDCPAVRANPDMPCFYYKQDFHPYFQVLDLVTGKGERFTGNYTFRVIGGSQQDLGDVKHYKQEKQELYNLQNHGNDETLIWIPIEEEMPLTEDSTVIFNHKHNGVLWRCQQNSPCSDVPLKFPYAPEYYFLIEVSNRDVDASRTYCDYTLQFIIRVHGFTISPMQSVRIVLWTLFILCGCLSIFVAWNHNKQHPFGIPAFLKQRKPKVAPVVKVEDTSAGTRYRRGKKDYLTVPNRDAVSSASSEQVLDVYAMPSAVFRRIKREQESNYSMMSEAGSSSEAHLPGGDSLRMRPSAVAPSIPEEPSQEFNQ